VECEVRTHKGCFTASCPSGSAPGAYEMFELRDGDADAYHGRGVLRAVRSINKYIAPALLGRDPTKQLELDSLMVQALDQTANLSHLGANAILAVSLAVCKAGAAERGVPLYRHLARLAGNSRVVLPVPSFNILSGGVFSEDCNALPVQEFMIMPTGAKSFSEAMRMGTEVYHHIKVLLADRYGRKALDVGHDGAFMPPMEDLEEALTLLVEAIQMAGHTGKIKIALDVAASEFLVEDDVYDLGFKTSDNGGARQLAGEELVLTYERLCKTYPIVSIEDPFDQDDFRNTAALTDLGLCQVVGDDLLVNSPARVQAAIKGRVCNAHTLKLNQIGTVSESIEVVRATKESGWGVIACHRSGETEDSFLADLAVGFACGQIKSGAPCRSDRVAKYNQLLRIEEELGGERALYAGSQNLYRHIPWKKE